MDDKPVFYYATGTAYFPVLIAEQFKFDLMPIGSQLEVPLIVPGLNGKTAPFSGFITNDPFPVLMNSDLWNAIKVPYTASAFPMDASIKTGVDWIVAEVQKLKPGHPWGVGGTSQGAAVASYIYNEVRSGRLTNWASGFLCGVGFGNPMRQINYTNPWSSYSGCFDDPGSTTGGHGAFPANYRLTNCNQNNWIEFTNQAEVVAGVGDTPVGTWWQAGAGALLLQTVITPGSPGSLLFNAVQFLIGVASSIANSLGAPFSMNFFTYLQNAADPGSPNYWGPGPVTDSAGTTIQLPGGGHTVYAALPPPGYTGTETAYQLAFKHLDALALQWATSPSVLPPTSSIAGWSTSLLPPAA